MGVGEYVPTYDLDTVFYLEKERKERSFLQYKTL